MYINFQKNSNNSERSRYEKILFLFFYYRILFIIKVLKKYNKNYLKNTVFLVRKMLKISRIQ